MHKLTIKAILKQKDADNNWDVVKVKKIFTTTYSSNTSTDTDEEVSKQKQKQKRKEVVLTEFPKAPNASNYLQIDLTTKDNLTRSNSVNSIAPSVSLYEETSTSDSSGQNKHSLPNDDQGMNDVLGINNNNDLPKSIPAYKFLTADEKLEYLCESNALIMSKLNKIIFEKNTKTKCNDKSGTDQKCSTEEIKQAKGSLIYDYFPLKDINAVEEFEKLLKNKTFTVPQAQTLLQLVAKNWKYS
ncbi:uncharacterized protein [Temnothorax longispinosus]|uniref:uncharacterized protein isoform X2 n=1 Tax=Temnothorax longispinosus TaxID=300112 RepID=UPI003A99A30C